MKRIKSQNFYEILGISRQATQDEIRQAYEISKQTFGKNSLATYSLFSDEENQEILSLIAEAYQTLSNGSQRKDYDQRLTKEERAARHKPVDGGQNGPGSLPMPKELEDDSDEPPASPAAMGLRARRASQHPTPAQPAAKPTAKAAAPQHGAKPEPAKAASQPQTPQQAKAPEQAKESKAAMPPKEAAPTPPPAPTAPAAPKADEPLARLMQKVEQYSGETLRQARKLKGVTLEELADTTKIRITYLRNIEEENFSNLPAPIYVRGFVKQLAQALSLPPDQVAQDILHRMAPPPPPVKKP